MWVTTYVSSSVPFAGTNPSALYLSRCRPAIRAWGELLIQLQAQRSANAHRPPIEIRARSLFGWPDNAQLNFVETSARWALRIRVDPHRCAVAKKNYIDPVFSWPSWSQLTAYLTELGRDIDVVEEAISPTTHGEAFTLVDVEEVFKYVAFVDDSLINDVVDYFSASIDTYLATWTTLAERSDTDLSSGWEVIVPEDGLLEVSTDTD